MWYDFGPPWKAPPPLLKLEAVTWLSLMFLNWMHSFSLGAALALPAKPVELPAAPPLKKPALPVVVAEASLLKEAPVEEALWAT